MKRNKIISMAICLIAGFLLVFSVAGCSFMGITIEPPSIHFNNNGKINENETTETNNATQPIARHIKDRAREILAQVGGVEE